MSSELKIDLDSNFELVVVNPINIQVWYKGNYIISLTSQTAAREFINRAQGYLS